MSKNPRDSLTEEEARDLWHRAAELQAKAAQRLEERSLELAPRESDARSPDGYALDHVRKAAVDAGISPEFIDQALAEAAVEGAVVKRAPDGILTRVFLGKVDEEVELSRVIQNPPEEVYAAMQRIFPGAPYHLSLVDTEGDDPLNGAVLVFDVPKLMSGQDMTFAYEMAYGDFKRFYVALRPLGEDDSRSELTIRSPLGPSKKIGLMAGAGLTAALTLLGGLIAGETAGPAAGWATMATVAGLGTWGWRAVYRYGIRRSAKAVEALLGAVASDIQTGGAFARRAWPELKSGGEGEESRGKDSQNLLTGGGRSGS